MSWVQTKAIWKGAWREFRILMAEWVLGIALSIMPAGYEFQTLAELVERYVRTVEGWNLEKELKVERIISTEAGKTGRAEKGDHDMKT